jgi:hypothetical protein
MLEKNEGNVKKITNINPRTKASWGNTDDDMIRN